MLICEQLREKREAVSLSREELAMKVNSEVSVIYKLETCVFDSMLYFWKVKQLKSYCLLINIEIDEFIREVIFMLKNYEKLLEYYEIDYNNINELSSKNSKFFENKSFSDRKRRFKSRADMASRIKVSLGEIRKIEQKNSQNFQNVVLMDFIVYWYFCGAE
jgi:transcriptional regulator with XRE-family HTH domain